MAITADGNSMFAIFKGRVTVKLSEVKIAKKENELTPVKIEGLKIAALLGTGVCQHPKRYSDFVIA